MTSRQTPTTEDKARRGSLRLRLLFTIAAALTPILIFAGFRSYLNAQDSMAERRNQLTEISDRAIDEEIQTLARDRGWSLPETRDYLWTMVQDDYNTVVPRVLRVVARDLFELDEMRRRTDDDEVAALASTLHSERRALAQSLEAEHPEFTLPGAK